jgi:hypothetical protein
MLDDVRYLLGKQGQPMFFGIGANVGQTTVSLKTSIPDYLVHAPEPVETLRALMSHFELLGFYLSEPLWLATEGLRPLLQVLQRAIRAGLSMRLSSFSLLAIHLCAAALLRGAPYWFA